MIIAVAFFVALVGLLIYAFSKDPKVAEVGRVLFFCGTLVTLLNVGGVVKFLTP